MGLRDLRAEARGAALHTAVRNVGRLSGVQRYGRREESLRREGRAASTPVPSLTLVCAERVSRVWT